MPSKSPAQARLMAGVAHNPAFAKKVGIPQSVGEEFNDADRGMGELGEKAPFSNKVRNKGALIGALRKKKMAKQTGY